MEDGLGFGRKDEGELGNGELPEQMSGGRISIPFTKLNWSAFGTVNSSLGISDSTGSSSGVLQLGAYRG